MKLYDTPSELLNNLNKRGFTIGFNMYGVYCKGLDRHFKPEKFKITEFHRFDNDSDPGAQSIVYALETKDNYKGVLVDAYGMYSDPLSFEMIQKLKTH
ncbi:MAG: phosphoribosylpyrophosphate synthetase [Flavobacteriaceae bacterium]|uniref:phosphoribosylpyrophosphate synthetase n=1 Tax=Gelidibacter japonicus TaxID=1962232 RepID=UPI001D7DEDD4|nr:phosphoribosylpyrophosphate synthetase [Flavobacteriaceae bacterium]